MSKAKQIIFDDNGIDFMLMNIFGHDFVHDFNPSSMGDRLKKIKVLISEINEKIPKEPTVGGGIKKKISRKKIKFKRKNKYSQKGGAGLESNDINNMNYRDLQKELKSLGLSASGKTEVLKKRLKEAIEQSGQLSRDNDNSNLSQTSSESQVNNLSQIAEKRPLTINNTINNIPNVKSSITAKNLVIPEDKQNSKALDCIKKFIDYDIETIKRLDRTKKNNNLQRRRTEGRLKKYKDLLPNDKYMELSRNFNKDRLENLKNNLSNSDFSGNNERDLFYNSESLKDESAPKEILDNYYDFKDDTNSWKDQLLYLTTGRDNKNDDKYLYYLNYYFELIEEQKTESKEIKNLNEESVSASGSSNKEDFTINNISNYNRKINDIVNEIQLYIIGHLEKKPQLDINNLRKELMETLTKSEEKKGEMEEKINNLVEDEKIRLKESYYRNLSIFIVGVGMLAGLAFNYFKSNNEYQDGGATSTSTYTSTYTIPEKTPQNKPSVLKPKSEDSITKIKNILLDIISSRKNKNVLIGEDPNIIYSAIIQLSNEEIEKLVKIYPESIQLHNHLNDFLSIENSFKIFISQLNEDQEEFKEFLILYYRLISYYFFLDDKEYYYEVIELLNDRDVINQLKLYLVTECKPDDIFDSMMAVSKKLERQSIRNKRTKYFSKKFSKKNNRQTFAASNSRTSTVNRPSRGGWKQLKRKKTKKLSGGSNNIDDNMKTISMIKTYFGPVVKHIYVDNIQKLDNDKALLGKMENEIKVLIKNFKLDNDFLTKFKTASQEIKTGKRNTLNKNKMKEVRGDFLKKLNEKILNIYIGIREQKLEQLREKKNQYEKEKAKRLAKRQLEASKRGNLNDADKENVNKINLLVVAYVLNKLGFVVNKTTWDGKYSTIKDVLIEDSITDNDILKGQYEILKNLIISNKGLGGIDDKLTELFKGEYENTSSKKINSLITKKKSKVVINNAAQGVKKYFCPLSSIIDGQSTCTYRTATEEDGFEYSDEYKFIITNRDKSKYYNCLVKYNNDKTIADIIIEFNLDKTNVSFINTKTNVKIGKELEANYVLPQIIKTIINAWSSINFPLLSSLTKKTNISYWDYIFINHMEDIMKIGPNKNFGDLFQEVSTVAKNGAMTGTQYYDDDSIKEYDDSGDADRLGLMGDRPSGFRIVYILKKALTESDINTKAHGGYYGPSGIDSGNTLIV